MFSQFSLTNYTSDLFTMQIFVKQAPFHPAKVHEVEALIGAGVTPYLAEQCSGLDDHILSIARPMVAFDPNDRPTANETLKNISTLLD